MATARFNYTAVKNAIREREEAKVLLACEIVEGEAKRLCPVDQGNLLGSFSHEVQSLPDEIVGVIKNSAEYAAAVEFGSKPHVIEPKDKKTLSFFADGKRIFTKIVHHPGFAGTPFLRGAMLSKKREIEKILQLQ